MSPGDASKRRPLHLQRDDLDIRLAVVANHDLEFLRLTFADCSMDSDAWARNFIGESAFVMGWAADVAYDHWQNAEDPLEYEAAGRSYAALRTKRRDLPPPLDDEIIDTANNPGRYVIRDGFIEAVGSPMWLGERIWTLTGVPRRRVLDAQWLNISEPVEGVLRINAGPAPFTSAEGEQGVNQIRLRTLLFGDVPNQSG